MNNIQNFWRQLSKTVPLYEWLLDHTEVVKIHSYKKHPEVKKMVEHFLNFYTPEIKACYDNSIQFYLRNSNCNYCLGYTSSIGFPIEHAWNSYKGFHFDLTAELALGEDFKDYMIVKEFGRKDLSFHFQDTSYPPDFMNYTQKLIMKE